MSSGAHYAECDAQLRERDRDLWLACLFAPQPARRHIHAIYAFVLETADVRAKVTQPTLGEMRLRWWADTIMAEGGAGEGPRAHPVADALLDTIERFHLPREPFVELAEERMFIELYDDPVETLERLESYCRKTVTAPMRLAAQVLGADLVAPAATAFDDAGMSLGLTRILRALPDHADRQSLLPADVLARHGVSPNDVRARMDSAALRAALAELRQEAQNRFETARHAAASLTAGREALLPAATAPLFLERMSRKDYDPFREIAEPSPLRRQWRLWRAARGVGL